MDLGGDDDLEIVVSRGPARTAAAQPRLNSSHKNPSSHNDCSGSNNRKRKPEGVAPSVSARRESADASRIASSSGSPDGPGGAAPESGAPKQSRRPEDGKVSSLGSIRDQRRKIGQESESRPASKAAKPVAALASGGNDDGNDAESGSASDSEDLDNDDRLNKAIRELNPKRDPSGTRGTVATGRKGPGTAASAPDPLEYNARPRDLFKSASSRSKAPSLAGAVVPVVANSVLAAASAPIFSRMQFSDASLSLHPKLVSLLEKDVAPAGSNALTAGGFGLSTCTNVQSAAIPLISSRFNVLIKSQTGSGKTLAYLLPIINELMAESSSAASRQEGTKALIIAPTRELCAQIADIVQKLTQVLLVAGVTMWSIAICVADQVCCCGVGVCQYRRRIDYWRRKEEEREGPAQEGRHNIGGHTRQVLGQAVTSQSSVFAL
jgi:hypothetical protein